MATTILMSMETAGRSLISRDHLAFDFKEERIADDHGLGLGMMRSQRRGEQQYRGKDLGFFDRSGAVVWWVRSVGM